MQPVLERGSIDIPLTFEGGLIQLSFIPVCSPNTCNISVKLCRYYYYSSWFVCMYMCVHTCLLSIPRNSSFTVIQIHSPINIVLFSISRALLIKFLNLMYLMILRSPVTTCPHDSYLYLEELQLHTIPAVPQFIFN